MINLNEEKFESKELKVFNGGEAGVALNVTMKVEKKKTTDNENMPDYKLILVDENGGEVNKGFYADFEEKSEGFLVFFVKEMKHLFNLVGVEWPTQIESYEKLLHLTMKTVHENAGNKKFNTAVTYGRTEKPSRYLQIPSCLSIVEETNKNPYLGKNPLMTRMEPDEIEIKPKDDANTGCEDSSDDLPW